MQKPRIFITGGKGMLASEIESFYFKKGFEVFAPTHQELDITDISSLEQSVLTYKPHYIFHTAALFPDFCEDNTDLAFKVNSWATKNLARISQKIDSTFVYISTCGLFGDEIKYYSEYDKVELKTIYAHSKYLGETLGAMECKKAYIIRPGWLFGGNKYHNNNFVYQRYLEALKSSIIDTAGDKYGSPTYTGDLVKKIEKVLEVNLPGTYHITNSGCGRRADYVKKIIKSFKLKTKVRVVDSSYFPRRADVPACEMLNNLNIKFIGLCPLPPWQEAVERFVRIMLKKINET